MKDNNDDKSEREKIDKEKKENGNVEESSAEQKNVDLEEDQFIFRDDDESSEVENDTKTNEGLDKKAKNNVIAITAIIMILSIYNAYIIFVVPIMILISLIGNFYYRWKIKNSTEKRPLYRGLKKGFLISFFILIVPVVGILILFGSCMMIFAI